MAQAFEHYRFTGDKDFLKAQALLILTGLVQFFNDFFIEKDGYLVMAPTLSPENAYITSDNVTGALTFGPASDNQVCSPAPHNFSQVGHVARDCG